MNSVSVTVLTKRGVRSHTCNIPESVTELTAADDKYIIQVSSLSDGTSRHLMLLHHFMQLPDPVFYSIPAHVFIDLMDLVSWIKVEPNAVHTIPQFEIDGIQYAGPEVKFQNGSAWEYVVADEYYTDAIDSESTEDLYLFMATIIRPVLTHDQAVTVGDIRQPLHYNFNKYDIRHRANIFEAHFSDPEHKAIEIRSILYFEGLKRFVHDTYGTYLFKPPPERDEESDAIDYEQVEQPADDSGATFGWWSLFMSVAADGLFGNLESVYRTNFHQFCMHIVDKTKMIDAHNKKIETQKMRNDAI